MKRRGFTLIELLAVIAILALLVIIALPNVLKLFNDAKLNTFVTELRNIYKTAQTQWVSESLFGSGEIVYSKCNNEECEHQLSLSGRGNIEYFIKINKKGKVIEFAAKDGTYQYNNSSDTGISAEEIKASEVQEIAKINTNDVITIACASVDDGLMCGKGNFASDTWNQIATNIKNNLCYYAVGSTKEIKIDGNPYTLRVANNTEPSECTNLSESSCGFIVEFMNIYASYKYNEVGLYLANTLTPALEEVIGDGIIQEIDVIRQNGPSSITTDENQKLFLLGAHEIYEIDPTIPVIGTYGKEEYSKTRQLDYYAENGVKGANSSGVTYTAVVRPESKKWWLRTCYNDSKHFGVQYNNGRFTNLKDADTYGVVPAFRVRPKSLPKTKIEK